MVSKTKIMTECPSCGETILFDRTPKLGQLIQCRFCEEALEVIDLEPVLLDWPLDDDYSDYDDDLDEEDW